MENQDKDEKTYDNTMSYEIKLIYYVVVSNTVEEKHIFIVKFTLQLLLVFAVVVTAAKKNVTSNNSVCSS